MQTRVAEPRKADLFGDRLAMASNEALHGSEVRRHVLVVLLRPFYKEFNY